MAEDLLDDDEPLFDSVVRRLHARNRNRGQMFRVGSPPATLKIESTLSFPAIGNFTAAQGAADATFIIYAPLGDLGVDFSTGFIRINILQHLNTYRCDIGDIANGNVAMPMSIEPRTMVVGVSPTDQGRVKAWVNGILLVDSPYNGTSWTNGIQAFFLLDGETSLANSSLPQAEIIVGALPAIF